MNKLSQAIVLASALTAGLAAVQTAQAEVSANAGVASEYLWRGQTLGTGVPQVSGGLDYSHESGLYAGTWIGSGDTTYGTEYDLYAGYAPSFGDFGLNLGYATYIYSDTASDDINDVAELVLGFSYGDASLTFYKSTDADANGDYLYTSLGYGVGDFSFTVGNVSNSEALSFLSDYTHVDITYAYNDKVSFTLSQIVDEDIEGSYDTSPNLVVSYSLPIDM